MEGLTRTTPSPSVKSILPRDLSGATQGTVDRLILTTPELRHKALCNGGLSFVFCPHAIIIITSPSLLSALLLILPRGWLTSPDPREIVSWDLDWITLGKVLSTVLGWVGPVSRWFIWFQVEHWTTGPGLSAAVWLLIGARSSPGNLSNVSTKTGSKVRPSMAV